MRVTNTIFMSALLVAMALPTVSHAASYSVGQTGIAVSVPDGFLALSGVDPNNFANVYQKRDPNLLEFFCNVNDSSGQGACNSPRVLKLRSFRQFADVQFDGEKFAKLRADTRFRMENANHECSQCQEEEKRIPGIVKVELLKIFAETDRYMGYSQLYTYTNRKSVESSLIVDIKGKLLILHASSDFHDDGDSNWTQELLTRWAKQIVEQNS